MAAATVFALTVEKCAHGPEKRLMKAVVNSTTVRAVFFEVHEPGGKLDEFVCFGLREINDKNPFEVNFGQAIYFNLKKYF